VETGALNLTAQTSELRGERIRIRGLVQGVGLRPAVWRLAQTGGLRGRVWNDAEGVMIEVWGSGAALDLLVSNLAEHAPPLARIDSIERRALLSACRHDDFIIADSTTALPHTGIVADAAVCSACLDDTLDPFSRRYRYPFTNCTHCGPRFSIVTAIPYDRGHTSMAAFTLCGDCRREYDTPADRRFHAQPNACYVCGPAVRLERSDGRTFALDALTQLDVVDAVTTLLKQGEIVAIKGIGGFHLACDATNKATVARLRQRKQRYYKPFALMARDLEIIRDYCTVGPAEQQLLQSPAAPIVLLPADGPRQVAAEVEPAQRILGFMLPYTPLHHLILRRMERPIVLTSGNLSEEPQCFDNHVANTKLARIADYLLLHDRDIVNRVDDSVVRIMAGEPRLLRRARGYAPASLALPPGFEAAPELLALGGELKNTFCLLKDAQAILSQHIGDLENAPTYADYQHNIALYQNLFQHRPQRLVIDAHPEYLSAKLGRGRAGREDLALDIVQHHHAHIAACLADNQVPLHTRPVLGVALDGLGYGTSDELWGGEFLLADYIGFERLGTFKPVALLGGAQAMREPWRNTYAHIMAELGWAHYKMNFAELELTHY
jgi:hydrogenase maturation protein HypF